MPARFATLFGTTPVDLIFEVGFDSDPTVAIGSTVWTDVSSDVIAWQWKTGKQNELDRFEAGHGAILLDNRVGDYDPTNAAGLHFGNVKPRRRLRIAFQFGGNRFEIASGFVDRWVQQYVTKMSNAGMATTRVDFTDAFGVLEQTELLDSALAHEIEATKRATGADAVWYRLGERLNETRIAVDSFGDTGRDGTYIENPQSVAGLAFLSSDGAVEFTPSADIGDAALIANMAAPFPVTIEMLAQVELNEDAVLLDARRSTGPATELTANLLIIVQGFVRVQVFEDGPGLRRIDSLSRVDDGQPHHIVIRLNSATSFQIFIDGVDDTDPASETTIGPGTGTLIDTAFWYIGPFGQEVVPNAPFVVDEVVIWRASISDTNIEAHALAALDPAEGARPESAFGGDNLFERFTRILDFARIPAADRDLDTGNTIFQPTALGGTALAYLQLVNDTEFGAFFINPAGQVRARQRDALFTETRHTDVQVTFGDDQAGEVGYTEIEDPILDDERVRNFALIARERGAIRRAQDETSIDQHYIHRFVRENLLHASDLVSQDYADFIVGNFAQPQVRVDALELNPRTAPAALDAISTLQLEDRVRVVRRPPGGQVFDQEFHIIGIEHTSSAAPREWTVRYLLAPVGVLGDEFWLIGVVGRSEIGETTVVGF